jgi:hypothetical protein
LFPRRLKVNFALLSAMAAERLSNGDNQLIEEMSRKVRSRSAMRVEKELKALGAVMRKELWGDRENIGIYWQNIGI